MSRFAVYADTLYTMSSKGCIDDGVLIVDDGVIRDVGPRDKVEIPDSVEVKDHSSQVVIPGLIDAHTHVGIHEEGEGWEGQDTNEATNSVTPQVRGLDGINPSDFGFQDAAVAGVTSINVGPGSGNVIGGQFSGVKTGGSEILQDLIIKEPTAMKMATGENPKRVYGEKDSIPSTRPGTAAVLRKALFDARNYLERKKNSEEDQFKVEFEQEALIPVIEGRLKAKIHAHRADDIATAIRIAEEFGLRYSIDHCTEGHKIASFLGERGVESVVGPSLTARSKREVVARTFKTPKLLNEAGAKVAITTDSPVVPIQYLPLMAGFAVREGMDEFEALKAITINAAEIAEIDNRVGSLEEGKDADFLACDGLPFQVTNNIDQVYIEGEKIDREELPSADRPSTY